MMRRTTGWPQERQRKAAGLIVSSNGEAIADLMLEVAQFFFRLRWSENRVDHQLGRWRVRFHAQRRADGPLTVPQIAQMRPTSRQRMQRLADELAAEGLVEFIDNPRHRRSKLVRLTSKGDARYRELSARFLAIASAMGADLSEADIRKTTEMVRRLSDETKGRAEQLPRSIRLLRQLKLDSSCARQCGDLTSGSRYSPALMR